MPDAEIDALLDRPRVGILGTIDADGKPSLVPVWHRWLDGAALICTQTYTRKWRNIERDARVTLCVDTKEAPYRAAIVEGTAEPVPDADYDATLQALATHYLGDAGGRKYMGARTPTPETSMVFRIRPDRIVSWAY
jgi:hypothetical protein